MKTDIGSPLYNTIRKKYVVDLVKQQLIAEWNWNRFVKCSAVTNPPQLTDAYDTENFPISAICEPHRPTNCGIVKAREGESEVSDTYKRDPDPDRYYVSDADDVYKYWSSNATTDETNLFPLNGDGSSQVQPAVDYERAVEVNKAVILFEVSWRSPDDGSLVFDKPTDYEVYTRATLDDEWVSIGSNFDVPDTGRIELYWDGTSWGTLPLPPGPTTTIQSIKVEVREMHRADVRLNLIEISARLYADLSKLHTKTDDSFDIGQRNWYLPLGQASSNTATVNFFNGFAPRSEDRFSWAGGDYIEDDQLGYFFNGENPNSPLYGLTDMNAKLTLTTVYDTSDFGGALEDPVQEFVMFTELWSGQTDDTVTVSLRDESGYLQEAIPPKVFYQGQSLGRICWQLCDLVGFDRYEMNHGESDPDLIIDVFYTDGEKSVWEIFADLCLKTQAAIYFDSYGMLKISTRERMYDPTKSPQWTLRGLTSGREIEDISTWEPTDQFDENQVTVRYTPAEFGDYSRGYPVQSVVWQPTDTVVLRETPLVKTCLKYDDNLFISPKDVRIWPFSGMMQIEAELITYQGKEFIYFQGGQRNVVTVNSEDEYTKYNNMTPSQQRYKNHYTGKVMITERGSWNSAPADHHCEADGYNVRSIRQGSHHDNVAGFKYNRSESAVTLSTNPSYTTKGWLLATRGTAADQGFHYLGTRMKFNSGSRDSQRAGIVFNNDTNDETGYYVELRPTDKMSANERKTQQEISFYSKTADQVVHKLGGLKGTGTATFIPVDVYFEVDIAFKINEGLDHFVDIWINGQHVLATTIPNGSGLRQLWNGKFGLYTRGNSSATFDYLYAIGRDEDPWPDNISFLDRVTSGYMGNVFQREFVYRLRDGETRKTQQDPKEQAKYAEMFMDEFGPLIHEIREFQVDFDSSLGPALMSNLLVTNDSEVLCPWYYSDAFSADFVLVNAARENAVVSGDDTLQYAGGSSVQQQLLVYGNVLIHSPEATIVVKDDEAIKKRGLKPIEIQSDWIQNKEAAQQIADWVVTQWSQGIEEVTVTTFGNPLLELGDLVAVDFPRMNKSADTDFYFVVGVANAYDGGLTTTLTLRERKT